MPNIGGASSPYQGVRWNSRDAGLTASGAHIVPAGHCFWVSCSPCWSGFSPSRSWPTSCNFARSDIWSASSGTCCWWTVAERIASSGADCVEKSHFFESIAFGEGLDAPGGILGTHGACLLTSSIGPPLARAGRRPDWSATLSRVSDPHLTFARALVGGTVTASGLVFDFCRRLFLFPHGAPCEADRAKTRSQSEPMLTLLPHFPNFLASRH